MALRAAGLAPELVPGGSRAALMLPLAARGDALGALLCVIGSSGRGYDERDLELGRALARYTALALENVRLRQELHETTRTRDNFIAAAAHDLRSPLTVLLGQTQMLEKRAQEDGLSERALRSVQSIRHESARLDRMIAALLDFSRMQRGALTLDLVELDVAALVRQLVGELQPTLTRHVITVVGDETLLVRGDAARLEQVFQRLLNNAVKYSPGGGTVLVQLQAADGQAQVAVSDQGIGIPAEARPRLFQQLFRAANATARGIPGKGLGLYVVRQLVSLHGGTVSVASEEEVGSTFTVRLPLAA
jgi:signal transduction histidine kinase